MTEIDASSIPWREPWHPIDSDSARKAERELHREMCAGHVLFERRVVAVGYRQDCDDLLFYLGEAPPRFAVVHLTYQRETTPRWPETSLYDTLDAWITQAMIPDAEDFAA